MTSRRNIGTIDLDTGEIQQGIAVLVGIKRSPYGARWYMSSQDAAIEIAKDPKLSKSAEALRVLWYLIGRIDFENYIHIQQNEIAIELGINKQNVSRAIKLLVERKVLLQGPKIGRSNTWRLNPHYGWKGKVKHLDEQRHLTLVK